MLREAYKEFEGILRDPSSSDPPFLDENFKPKASAKNIARINGIITRIMGRIDLQRNYFFVNLWEMHLSHAEPYVDMAGYLFGTAQSRDNWDGTNISFAKFSRSDSSFGWSFRCLQRCTSISRECGVVSRAKRTLLIRSARRIHGRFG